MDRNSNSCGRTKEERKGERGREEGGGRTEKRGRWEKETPCTPSFMTIPVERAGYNLRFKKLKTTANSFPQSCSYKIRHPKSNFF